MSVWILCRLQVKFGNLFSCLQVYFSLCSGHFHPYDFNFIFGSLRVIELMVAALNAKFSHKPTMTSYLPYPSGGCVMHFRNCGGKFKIFGRSMVLVVLTVFAMFQNSCF